MHGKGKCSICGLEKDIAAKVPNGGETLYCKQCLDNEMGSMWIISIKLILFVLNAARPTYRKMIQRPELMKLIL
jgi:NMD protein affecting ribosome stability and mRNA decay